MGVLCDRWDLQNSLCFQPMISSGEIKAQQVGKALIE